MASAVKFPFSSRVDSFLYANIPSQGVLPSICDSLREYNIFHYPQLWFSESILSAYMDWKTIVENKILEKESDDWFHFCTDYPSMRVAQACLKNIYLYQLWSIADRYSDLVRHLHGT